MSIKKVYGVGVNNGSYPSRVDGVIAKEYKLWINILKLCYSTKRNKGYFNAYKDCVVSDNFKRYEYFYEWCNAQEGFDKQGFCLSKNALIKSCKIFSELTCAFIPTEISKMLSSSKADRGAYPVGVDYNEANKIFRARVNIDGKPSFIGIYSNPDDAFKAYKKHKENKIKNAAKLNKGRIRKDVYDYLMSYEVEITD